jgi:hypothetical protein
MEKEIVAQVLLSLSAQRCITHLAVDNWPSPLETEFAEKVEKDWCPSLEDLTLLRKDQHQGQQERMESVAAFLTERQELGLPPLQRLTIHKEPGAIDFPYECFKHIRLRQLRVLVPL